DLAFLHVFYRNGVIPGPNGIPTKKNIKIKTIQVAKNARVYGIIKAINEPSPARLSYFCMKDKITTKYGNRGVIIFVDESAKINTIYPDNSLMDSVMYFVTSLLD